MLSGTLEQQYSAHTNSVLEVQYFVMSHSIRSDDELSDHHKMISPLCGLKKGQGHLFLLEAANCDLMYMYKLCFILYYESSHMT